MPSTTKWYTLMTAQAVFALMLSPTAMPQSIPAAARIEALLATPKVNDIRSLAAMLPEIIAPGLQALVGARVAASRLDTTTAGDDLQRYWHSADRNPERDAIAWSIAAESAFAANSYAQAAKATQAWLALLAKHDPRGESADVAQFHGMASLLTGLPPQMVTLRNPVAIRTWRDKAELLRTKLRINGIEQDAVLDTGANLSVISLSTAQRLGVRILDDKASVASGSREQVATRVGVADRMQIAGIALSHVVFLVLADQNLEMPLPGGYKIDTIVGFPVLRALGRMRFGEHSLEPLTPAANATAAATSNLYVVGNDLFVDTDVDGISIPLHLDTGAPASSLSTLFARRYPKVLDGLTQEKRRSASAGGAITQQSAVWQNVRVRIDGGHVKLPKLSIATREPATLKTHTFGTLGLDVLKRFDAFTLDLRTMRLQVAKQN